MTTSECLPNGLFVFLAALSLLLLWFGVLRGCFPLAAKKGTRRGCPFRTPEGATKWSTRREAKSCADGLVVYDEAHRGMYFDKDFRARNEVRLLGGSFPLA